MTFEGPDGAILKTDCGEGPEGCSVEPVGTKKIISVQGPCTLCPEDPPEPPNGLPLPSPARPVDLEGQQPYSVVTLPTVYDEFEPFVATALEIRAGSESAALTLTELIEDGGPGIVVPPAVDVRAHVTLTLVGDDVEIRSSLPERFRHFAVRVDGAVIASKDPGFSNNVTMTPGRNGWVTLSTVLPLTSIAPVDGEIVVTQAGRSAAETSRLVLRF